MEGSLKSSEASNAQVTGYLAKSCKSKDGFHRNSGEEEKKEQAASSKDISMKENSYRAILVNAKEQPSREEVKLQSYQESF